MSHQHYNFPGDHTDHEEPPGMTDKDSRQLRHLVDHYGLDVIAEELWHILKAWSEQKPEWRFVAHAARRLLYQAEIAMHKKPRQEMTS